ncbi:hypothetical protein [Pseudofrankia saprophytica]|uniref:hypothetical protein n=1 Tax=Pseudofrankia saprophytica TaxID=298655 RepID=UPI0002DE4B87|nr:hypothetical protein [Pseudofrankia saprophytica]
MVTAAQQVADHLTATGRPVTRTALAHGVRTAGHTLSNDRARLLLEAVRPAPPGDRP